MILRPVRPEFSVRISSVNRYRKGVRLIRKESTFGTCTTISFERYLRDITLKKTRASPNLRSRMHVQDSLSIS